MSHARWVSADSRGMYFERSTVASSYPKSLSTRVADFEADYKVSVVTVKKLITTAEVSTPISAGSAGGILDSFQLVGNALRHANSRIESA